jgi:hypothetical protein
MIGEFDTIISQLGAGGGSQLAAREVFSELEH